jgi:hypothetical protein
MAAPNEPQPPRSSQWLTDDRPGVGCLIAALVVVSAIAGVFTFAWDWVWWAVHAAWSML